MPALLNVNPAFAVDYWLHTVNGAAVARPGKDAIQFCHDLQVTQEFLRMLSHGRA